MKRRLHLLVILALTSAAASQGVVDRILVVVNSQPVLLSDWAQAAQVEAFLENKPLRNWSDEEKTATLERLIDQELMKQQMEKANFTYDPREEVDSQVEQLRAERPNGKNDDAWKTVLGVYGITEMDLRERLAVQVTITRFLDMRFRTSVRVTRNDVERYYREKFLPQLRARDPNAAPPRLEQVSAQIERILTEEERAALTQGWLTGIRAQADIRRSNASGLLTRKRPGKQ